MVKHFCFGNKKLLCVCYSLFVKDKPINNLSTEQPIGRFGESRDLDQLIVLDQLDQLIVNTTVGADNRLLQLPANKALAAHSRPTFFQAKSSVSDLGTQSAGWLWRAGRQTRG